MKAAQWIDQAKAKNGWESDCRAAKEIGLSRNAISNYRGGLRMTLDEDTAIKVAAALGINPAGIIVDQVAERSKSPEVRTALLEAARHLCILCSIPNAIKVLAAYARRAGYTAFRAC